LRDPNRPEANIAKGRRDGGCDTSATPYEEAVPAMLDRVAGIGRHSSVSHWSMIRKSGNRFSEKIMLKQRDEIMMRFYQIAS
jgi:hypothetical protein